VRNAREEARDRVGGRYDVRVLEPSPPAVNEPPWFADDPLDGGEVSPVERRGVRTWAEVCAAEGDQGLLLWCWDRWLVPRPALAELPEAFGPTRETLHALAERVIAPARQEATGKIGLRFTYHGFGTPFFGANRQVRVEDGFLIDGDVRSDLGVDDASARALGDWYGYCTFLLEQLRADDAAGAKARVQLWPEHFDVAVDLGPEGAHANYGGSPGDDTHAEPYLYVGPWGDRPDSDFWNEPFGASFSYSELIGGGVLDPVAAGLAFLRRGKELLCSPSG
jgi:hypothetical protein